MVRVVRLALARHGNDGAVMKVVVPHGVETVAAGVERAHELHGLCFALGDEDDGAATRRAPGSRADLADDVTLRAIVNRLRRIQPYALELKLGNPVRGIGGEIVAHGLRVWPVEVQGLAPLVRIRARVVRRRVAAEDTAVRSEAVVDDIKDDTEAAA